MNNEILIYDTYDADPECRRVKVRRWNNGEVTVWVAGNAFGAHADGPALRDALLEAFPLPDEAKPVGGQPQPEPEDHPHDDGFKQRVDRAVEAATKAATKAASRAYLEAYGEAFRTALVEDEDRPLQVGDRVEVVAPGRYNRIEAGWVGVVVDEQPDAYDDELIRVRFDGRGGEKNLYRTRFRRVP